jgi:hypothetical protein
MIIFHFSSTKISFLKVTVEYEKCTINIGRAFDISMHQFVAQEPGFYDFSATALLKTDKDGFVILRLKRDKVSKLIFNIESHILLREIDSAVL